MAMCLSIGNIVSFRDVRALHFDPTKNDHLEYEIKATDKRVQEKEK